MKFLPLLPLLTRYPFLKVSAKVFEGLDVIKELEKYPEVVEIGKQIVAYAIDGKRFDREFDEGDIFCVGCEEKCINCKSIGNFSECDLCLRCFENCKLNYGSEAALRIATMAKISVLTHICSRAIASSLDDWVRMRYAVNEASYYAEVLSRDSDVAVKFVALDLGVKLRGWSVHVASYVKASSRIRSDEWRLVNRRLRDGYVDTSRREVERIIEELLRARLFEKVPSTALIDALSEKINEVKRKASREAKKFELDLGDVDVSCFPPCMKEILSELQRGMNVPHTARFAITSFLLNIGMSVDDIIELFKTAPDFDEEKTRYQVEHIAGERGKGVEYTSPACDTMRTYQNCVANCNVSHPLRYYAKCKKRKMRR